MKIILPPDFHLEIYPHPRPSDEFLNRLVEFYHRQPKPEMSKLWVSVTNLFQKRLVDALDARNISLVGDILCSMYATELVWGMDNQNGSPNQENPWPVALGKLCSAIGVVGEEISLNDALAAADGYFGGLVGCKGGGGMEGLVSGGRFIPRKLLEALTTMASLRSVRFKKPARVLELGAGLGFQCRALKLTVPWVKYDTLDLPVVSVIQAYLISQGLSEEAVWLQGEESHSGHEVFINGPLLTYAGSFDLVLNQDSLPEMPDKTQDDYLCLIRRRLKKGCFFVSINHEHGRDAQRPVHLAMKEYADMKLISRHPYGARDGYVEEIYEKV